MPSESYKRKAAAKFENSYEGENFKEMKAGMDKPRERMNEARKKLPGIFENLDKATSSMKDKGSAASAIDKYNKAVDTSDADIAKYNKAVGYGKDERTKYAK